MNNITYNIVEVTKDIEQEVTKDIEQEVIKDIEVEENPIHEISLNRHKKEHILDEIILKSSEYAAMEIDYELNYNIKYIQQIADYYNLKRNKSKRKTEIIIKILDFEMDPNNIIIVETRKRLFENFTELKNDPFFGKFIIS
jgi:hypothetical protein